MVYAGAGKSGMSRYGNFATVEREHIETAVRRRELRLVVATDAACEALNLQTLGTLINVGLPWNVSRLEQRLGRIGRFGQTRKSVDMLKTDDEWIENVEHLEEEMDSIHLREQARNAFELRYQDDEALSPDLNRWELCSRVLSRKDVKGLLSQGW